MEVLLASACLELHVHMHLDCLELVVVLLLFDIFFIPECTSRAFAGAFAFLLAVDCFCLALVF